MRGDGAGDLVVRGCGGVGGQVLQKDVPGTGPQGLVCVSHELGGGMFIPGGGGACRTRRRRVWPSDRDMVRSPRRQPGAVLSVAARGPSSASQVGGKQRRGLS